MISHTKPITAVVIHCTATPAGRSVSHDDLVRWHVAERGWDAPGYHHLIDLQGVDVPCRDEKYQGAHVRPQEKGQPGNNGTIGVAYAGGLDPVTFKPADTMTIAQYAGMERLLDRLALRYGRVEGTMKWLRLYGHRDLDPRKACPSFSVTKKFGDWWAVEF